MSRIAIFAAGAALMMQPAAPAFAQAADQPASQASTQGTYQAQGNQSPRITKPVWLALGGVTLVILGIIAASSGGNKGGRTPASP